MLATHGPLSGIVVTRRRPQFCGEGKLQGRECFCFQFPRLTGALIALVLSRGTIMQISRDLVNRDAIEIRSPVPAESL
jgi:hypothetical protein